MWKSQSLELPNEDLQRSSNKESRKFLFRRYFKRQRSLEAWRSLLSHRGLGVGLTGILPNWW